LSGNIGFLRRFFPCTDQESSRKAIASGAGVAVKSRAIFRRAAKYSNKDNSLYRANASLLQRRTTQQGYPQSCCNVALYKSG
jgi:hypothetical protein